MRSKQYFTSIKNSPHEKSTEPEYSIYGYYIEIPSIANLVLTGYGTANIIKSTLINIRLVAILHFYYKHIAVFVLAAKVEHCCSAV